jgi:single-stranded-DNA-specific exonuclease
MSSVSVTGKKWILKDFNSDDVNFIKDNFFLDEIAAKLLAIKKIKKEELNNYLNPAIKNILPNPNILKDMEKATKRTIKAIQNKEKIGIFGDYDVDGASSSALLGNFFKHINLNFEIYIPDRKTEGYGPNIQGFQKLISKNSNLIFTVDCGTLSFEPIKFLSDKKIDVVVLDHHQSEIKLPKAYSIINPNRIDDNSNLNYLCAAGVCFMFLISLNRELRNINWFKKNNIKEPNLINYLDLVSLGTVCDVVPLIGVNRAIVKQGLKILKLKNNLGLKTLFDICKIESTPTPYHLGYVLGPRINAGGRVGKCSHGANLLLNLSPQDAFKIASELDQFNSERKEIEKNLIKEVMRSAKNLMDPVLILKGPNWHQGIIGIIASRVKEKFNKPTIIISLNNKIGKGSARSIIGFDIGAHIIAAVQKGLLLKGGGHKMAGGFTINIDKIDKFKEFLLNKFKKLNINILEEKKIFIDSEISTSAINLDFFDKINNLAPFGSGNSEPRFSIINLKVLNSKIVGENHIKSILLGADGSNINSIAFNATESDIGAYLLNKMHKSFNIVGKLSLNEWKGKKNVEFIIEDISVNKKRESTVPSSIG